MKKILSHSSTQIFRLRGVHVGLRCWIWGLNGETNTGQRADGTLARLVASRKAFCYPGRNQLKRVNLCLNGKGGMTLEKDIKNGTNPYAPPVPLGEYRAEFLPERDYGECITSCGRERQQIPPVEYKPTMLIDFDGVIHSYASGWQGANVVSDEPVPGALDFVNKAILAFHVAIYSSRNAQEGGVEAMVAWLNKYGFPA